MEKISQKLKKEKLLGIKKKNSQYKLKKEETK
jgi:hypothetical protein